MGWQCKECLNINNYREKSCVNCQSPISETEVKKIVSEEIRLQQKKILKLPLKSWLWTVKYLDLCIERRKYINIATGLILAVAIATNFAFLKDFNISSIWEKSAIEYKRDIFKNAKHKNIAYELNKKASQTLETLKTNKQGIITDNLHLAFKDKEIREIHVKKIDPVKTKLLEEKLWKAIYKIQPLF
ncbi:MAG TPA: hypothetical protein GXZ27_01160 [Thermoanaerobacterales bacterium]|jgi:hypothetical protein|nr:hypothetical protein [Thermoanaerobacterales bacterium]